jgi:hypothetical protein
MSLASVTFHTFHTFHTFLWNVLLPRKRLGGPMAAREDTRCFAHF